MQERKSAKEIQLGTNLRAMIQNVSCSITFEETWKNGMELELKEYFGIIKKRIWMITAIVLVASITTGIISFFII